MRGLEARREDAIVVDPYAEALAGEAGRQFTAQLTQWRPDRVKHRKSLMPFRTRYLDDALLERDPAIQQVVILAAGLDARAYRLDCLEDCHVWEFDLNGDMMERKQRIMAEMNVTALSKSHHCLIADLVHDPWPEQLLKTGFDPSKPTFWSIEGLLYYLPKGAIVTLLQRLDAQSAPGSVFWSDMCGQIVMKEGMMGNSHLIYGEDDPLTGAYSSLGWDLSIQASLGHAGSHFGREWTPIQSQGEHPQDVPWFFVMGKKPLV